MFNSNVLDPEHPWVIVEEVQDGPWTSFEYVDGCSTLEGARAERRRRRKSTMFQHNGSLHIFYIADGENPGT